MKVIGEEQSWLANADFLYQIFGMVWGICYLYAKSDESELKRSFDNVAVVKQR
jgi:hypothetical protein